MNTMQTKPLRAYGIDVTQSSLQPIVKELGITDSDGNVKSVKNMSQAEKEILRYIATLKQAKIAMGDLANTIESPSNQLKVFRQQLVETKVAFSSLFIGALSKALPYANAFLMVIKETSKALATMFGIELKDYNAGIASQEGIYDGIADSADDASDAVKELKRQTLGFDEIHNINENQDSSTSVSGGIDQRLLDAITGYDNGMDKVRMKATEIRDSIMDWLGFTKEIDTATGEVSFKLDEGYTNLQKIRDILIAMGSIWIIKNIVKFLKPIINFATGDTLPKIIEFTKKIVSKLSGSEGLNSLIQSLGGASGIAGLTIAVTGWGIVLYDAWNKSEDFRQSVINLKNSFINLLDVIKEKLQPVKEKIQEFYNDILKPFFQILWDMVEPILELINQFLRLEARIGIDGLTTVIDVVIKLIKGDFKGALDELGGWLDILGGDFDEFKTNVSTAFSKSFESIKENANNIKTTLEEKIGTAIENVKQWFSELPEQLGESLGSACGTILNFLKQLPGKMYDTLNRFVTETLPKWKTNISEWVKNEIPKIISDIANFFKTLPGKILEKLSESANEFKEIGKKVLDWILGGLTNMESGIKRFGNSFVSKLKQTLGIYDSSAYTTSSSSIGSRATGGVYSNGSWKNISQYANGGSPSHGTMFVAGEAGAEIVGHINGKTEVLNQSQIASAIYSAVYSAMSQFNGGGVAEINVHASKDVIVETAINGINQRTNQTGICPVKIPTY